MTDHHTQSESERLDDAAREELFTLLGGLCDETLDEQQQARLRELLANAEARSIYRRYMNLHGTVRAYHAHAADVDFENFDAIESIESSHANGDDHSPENIAALNTMSRINAWLNRKTGEANDGHGAHGTTGTHAIWPVAAKVAAVVLSAAAVLVVAINLLHPTPTPPQPVATLVDSQHAQWVDEHNRLVFVKQGKALLPQTLRLTEGLAELKFNSGAVLLLDARDRPTTITLNSAAEAFLQLGKITARAEVASAKGFTVAVPGNQRVIDVSTAFGIIVDESGRSEVFVIQGSVDVSQVADDGSTTTIRMNQGEAARLEKTQLPIERIEQATQQFLAMLPPKPEVTSKDDDKHGDSNKSDIPFDFTALNTGSGSGLGDADQRWRIVAAKNVPGFSPMQAVVCRPLNNFRPNDASSQWLSNGRKPPNMPADAVFTFRARFSLHDADVRALHVRVRYIADNKLAAVRLNGRSVDISSRTELQSFIEFSTFNLNQGFRAGENVIEVDVANAAIGANSPNPLAVRLEFERVQP